MGDEVGSHYHCLQQNTDTQSLFVILELIVIDHKDKNVLKNYGNRYIVDAMWENH